MGSTPKARIDNDQAGCDYGAFTGVLLLDDLSGVRVTDFAADVLARVVRRRGPGLSGNESGK